MSLRMPLRMRRRRGFTLVELLVSAAVSLIIMATLATVFQAGIDTMRQLKSTMSLQDQLRAASTIIRRDLQGTHFVARSTYGISVGAGQLISGPKLSDQWKNDSGWALPAGGFFHIESSSAWSTTEGTDQDGFVFGHSNNTNFLIHFTTILPGNSQQSTFSALTSSGATVSSPAAEIAYFLDNNNTGATNNGTLQLYQLIRRQRLVALSTAAIPSLQTGVSTADIGVVAVNSSIPDTLANLVAPALRLGSTGYTRSYGSNANLCAFSGGTNGASAGDDVLLSNVLSFEVKANWDGGSPSTTTTDNPFDFLSTAGSQTFDTGGGGAAVRVKAIQIRLRVYDQQMRSTRQVTIVQDM